MIFTQIELSRCGTDGTVALITLSRPDKMNALTKVMEAELRAAFEHVDRDPNVRVVVLTGKGRAFCAGMDLAELETISPDDGSSEDWMRPYDMNRRADYQSRYCYFPAIRKPVICAINGAAAGIGFVFPLYCDIRFASSSAVFATAFSKRGLIAEHGIAWILPRIVGPGNAADLLYSSRKITAEEALGMRLVDRLVAPENLLEEVLAYADDMARNASPRSLQVIKQQLWDAPFQSLADAITVANAEMYKSFQSEDFKEGVAHFLEKRAARFSGN